jgi:ATP-dependent Clp protease ATP-binding subunit ClpC
MFERYVEKARRSIFFARYEASAFGSPVIDIEHLLLGILREDKELVALMSLQETDVETYSKADRTALHTARECLNFGRVAL